MNVPAVLQFMHGIVLKNRKKSLEDNLKTNRKNILSCNMYMAGIVFIFIIKTSFF